MIRLTVRRKIVKYLIKLGRRSTIIGVPSIFHANVNLPSKIFWIVSHLACWIILIVLVYFNILTYFNYSTIITIKIVHEMPTTFPGILFFHSSSLEFI